MLAALGGILGAGASLASGIMGADAASEAADTNWRINLLNYYQRERERSEAIAMANKLRAEQKLGSTDIRGTRSHFVAGKGWVTEGSPELLEMMKLQDKEQRDVLTKDAPLRRAVLQRNYTRGVEEEGLADTFKRQLQNTYTPSDEEFASQLYQAQASGLREASGDAGRRVFTQAMRTGNNSNFADIASGLQRADNSAYADARLKSTLMARGSGEEQASKRRKELSSLYNMFATRAQQLPETNYKPQAVDTNGSTDAFSKMLLAAGQDATKAYGAKGGNLDYIQPNYGMANAVGGGGSALASAFRTMGAERSYNGVSGFGSNSSTGGGGGMYQDEEHEG